MCEDVWQNLNPLREGAGSATVCGSQFPQTVAFAPPSRPPNIPRWAAIFRGPGEMAAMQREGSTIRRLPDIVSTAKSFLGNQNILVRSSFLLFTTSLVRETIDCRRKNWELASVHKHKVTNLSNPERDTTIVEVNVPNLLGIDGEEARLNIGELITVLQQALHDIPSESRDAAVLNIKAYGEYASLCVDVEFARLETDAELAERRAWLQKIDDDRERAAFATYQTLKQKFG